MEQAYFLCFSSYYSSNCTLNNKNIGTFGDAGFIAFSPGKPTASYLGAFYWSNKPYKTSFTSHRLYHLISFLSFYFNRINVYQFSRFKVFKILSKIESILLKFIDIKNDKLTHLDKKHIGGVLKAAAENKFSFRDSYFEQFCTEFDNNQVFRTIRNVRGSAKPHKIVILVNNNELALSMLRHFKNDNIAVINGYSLLDNNIVLYPNATNIDGRVIELPIEDHKDRMKYLFYSVNEFVTNNKGE